MARQWAEKTILLTRPQADSQALAAELRPMPSVIAPVMEIKALKSVQVGLEDALVLTSRHGVSQVSGTPRVTYCVGASTFEAAHGLNPILCGQTQSDLISHLRGSKEEDLTYLRGRHVVGGLAEALERAGLRVTSQIVYDQVETPWTDAVKQQIFDLPALCVPLFSPRSARLVRERLNGYGGHIDVIAMSQNIAEAWGGENSPRISAEPSLKAMISEIRA